MESPCAYIGAWLIHPFLIISGKLMIDSIPGMTQPMSWTIVNLAYMMVREAIPPSIQFKQSEALF
jgi:hypothetical protein